MSAMFTQDEVEVMLIEAGVADDYQGAREWLRRWHTGNDRAEPPKLEPSPPPTMWMEEVARAAITAAFRELPARLPPTGIALLAEALKPEDIERAVREAMTTPPPADDGGPSDPITAAGKAAIEQARKMPPMPPEAVATTLVQTMRHEPWTEPDAAQAWQLLAGMCILESSQAMTRNG